MITEAVIDMVVILIEWIITLLPSGTIYFPAVDTTYIDFVLDFFFYFFPKTLFVIVIGNVGIWMAVQFGWAIVEWIYKKVPGVD